MRARTRTAIVLCVFGLGPSVAHSQTGAASPPQQPPQLPPQEKQTLEQFGAANPACRQWTDGCAVCLRRDDGAFGCSLPGIACEPSSLTCRQVAHEPKPAGGSAPPRK